MSERRPEKTDRSSSLLGEVQAALWLNESLILALLEANLLDTDTILEAIDIVIAAKQTKSAEDPEVVRAAVTQLASIAASIAAAKTTADPSQINRIDRARQKPSTSK